MNPSKTVPSYGSRLSSASRLVAQPFNHPSSIRSLSVCCSTGSCHLGARQSANYSLLQLSASRRSCFSKCSYHCGKQSLKLCGTPQHFQRQHFLRSLHASIYSTQGIENDLSVRLPNVPLVTSTSRSSRSTVHALATEEDLCQFALKSVHSFSKCSIYKMVTDERSNRRTDGRTDEGTCREHYASGQYRLRYG